VGRPAPQRQASSPLDCLTPQERAVYDVLASSAGRVVSRTELTRAAGLEDVNPRRCDALLVGVRRAVGPAGVVTVRRRGWMLVD
jgi:DNA-binding response OmpR family regulator